MERLSISRAPLYTYEQMILKPLSTYVEVQKPKPTVLSEQGVWPPRKR